MSASARAGPWWEKRVCGVPRLAGRRNPALGGSGEQDVERYGWVGLLGARMRRCGADGCALICRRHVGRGIEDDMVRRYEGDKHGGILRCEGMERNINSGKGAVRPSSSAPHASRSLDAYMERSRERRCARIAARLPRLASFEHWRGWRLGGGRSRRFRRSGRCRWGGQAPSCAVWGIHERGEERQIGRAHV